MVWPGDITVRQGRMFEGRGGVKESGRRGWKSEGRRSKAEGNPKAETRSGWKEGWVLGVGTPAE